MSEQIKVSVVTAATDTATRNCNASKIIEVIRTGGKKVRQQVEQLRDTLTNELAIHGDEKRAKQSVNELKKQLPAVLWSGQFSERANGKLVSHSSLLCADLDSLNGELATVREKLASSPYLWALFKSPSGNGLKAVFRVPANAATHAGSFRAVEQHVRELSGVQIDQACKDVARLCFLSYDPDVYHNANASEIKPLPEPQKPKALPNGATNLSERQRVATDILGAVEWQSETSGFVTCPGKHLHTSGDNERDCKIDFDGVPTVHCFHNGCRGILDGVNHELRSRIGKKENTKPAKPRSDVTPESENKPAVTPRPLSELLDAIGAMVKRYVVLPCGEQAPVIATWIVHTWFFDAFDYTPYLFVFSASKRSGKSRVLEVIEQLAKNPQLTEGASTAALMRSNDESNPPTILLDEVDTIYSKKGDAEAENTRRFLNAGYRRGSKFLRCVGQGADISVKEFPAFCPKAFAGIDRCLPDTVLDRSLPIEIIRQSRDEKANRFRRREVEAVVAPMRAELEALAQQSGLIDALRAARPMLPEQLNDRAQDITEPLIAIADLAGGKWPEILRRALVKLCANEEDADIGVKLLGDIKTLFDKTEGDKLQTISILEGLVNIEDDAPWAAWYEDDLKQGRLKRAGSHLARKLKRYNIKPSKIRFGDDTAQGYLRSQFEGAWERYLPPSSPPFQINGTNGTDGTQPDFTRENHVPTSVPSTRNVPLSVEGERNTKHKGKTQNVPSVPSVPSYPGGGTGRSNPKGMTPGQFIAEATQLFNAKVAS